MDNPSFSWSQITRAFAETCPNLPLNTGRTWCWKDKDNILQSHSLVTRTDETIRVRDTALSRPVELALVRWVQELRDRSLPVSGALIAAKARQLGEKLRLTNFAASAG